LAMEDIVARHQGQLEHYAVPKHLRDEALRKVLAQEFACPALRKDVMNGVSTIVAGEPMAREGQVWVLDHLWLFQSARDARQQLEKDASLRSQMQDIATHFSKAQAETIDEIIVSLIHCAYSIKFGHNASDLYHYVISDVGALLLSAKRDFNVQVVPLYCVDTGKLVSLMWPVETIEIGTKIVRPHATTISLIQLGKQSYWENRYEDEEEFDWYCSYAQMRDLVKRYASPSELILIAGSGASTLPIDMEKDGFTKVTATDYAANVIEKMKEKHSNTSVTFSVADMTDMKEFASNSINCIIDKGCLDTMLLAPETTVESDGHVWKTVTPDNANEFPEAWAVMKECMRLLRPNGYMILLTYGNPNNRMGLLDWPTNESNVMWEIIECQQLSPSQDAPSIAKPFFIYVLQKQPH
ncbi:hypothetical protein THRCLA_06023, partial [Thraustotheca clavata]